MPHKYYRNKLVADNTTNLLRSRLGRDIAEEYPLPGNLERRAACERDFRRFCETYFPAAFSLPWSDDHLRVISRIQSAVLDGGLFALAMPRGSGKTTLCERAALWALLYGHRRFVVLVGATEAAAEVMLEHLKVELAFNDLLATDFRQVCYPIRRLENNADCLEREADYPSDDADSCLRWRKCQWFNRSGGRLNGCASWPVAHTGQRRNHPARVGYP